MLRRKPDPSLQLAEAERLAWLRLARTENVGPITFYQLIDRFGSASQALNALPELAKNGGRKKPLIACSATEAQREYDSLKKRGGELLTVLDTDYPLALSATDDAPPILSILGNPKLLNKSCIGIVGARNASLNGRKFAQKIATDLGARGHIIVSGLARGIDTSAHTGSLNTGTIAVVAGGIDVVYPEENQKLYEDIIEHGAIIAARLAGEQGREVYAVPGSPLDPRADGPNHLIREGATLIRSADDVIEGLLDFAGTPKSLPQKSAPTLPGLAENRHEFSGPTLQADILNHLSHTPVSVDELIRVCHVTISGLQSALLELELAGTVKRLPGNRICRIDNQNP